MEEKTLGGSVGTADINRDVGEEISIMEEKSLEITERLRMPSLSPEPEVGSECVSLEPEVSRELMTSPMESGRRSTQGIPEEERNVKFSHPDVRTAGKKSDRSAAQAETGVTKNRSKSSTLSLHAVAAAREQEEEPLLQRRNSIHNVPFVDVNDPDTRTRMERYKEERRSMLRAKYKAEDYLSTTFARKKKVSSTSSCDGDVSSVTLNSNKSISASPPDSPSLGKMSTPDKDPSHSPQSPLSSKISLKKIDLKKTEQIPSRPCLEAETGLKSPDAVIYKTQVITSVKKPFVPPPVTTRPDDLAISSFNKAGEHHSQSVSNNRGSPSPPAQTEEIVNVRERASIFGPRK